MKMWFGGRGYRLASAPALNVALVLGIGIAISGCSVFEHPPHMRGERVQPYQLKELVPGVTKEADVTSLLGTPTARATFNDSTWLYIAETTRPEIGSLPAVEDQRVVALHFDQNGVLQKVEQRNADDARTVAMNSRVTPSPGSSASFFQQLFGNIGRYSPGGLLGSALNQSHPSGGVPGT